MGTGCGYTSSHGRPDEVVASETLNNHLRCNSSFVQDIFQAQYRSSLRCPRCQCESNTFDPFMCVSLPIPHVELMPIFVTVVYLNQQPKQVCLGVSVVCGSSFGELRRTLAQDCGLELASLIIVEVDGSGFHRTFADDCSVDSIGSGGSVHAIELPVDAAPAEDQGPFVLVTWLNVVAAEPCYVRFGGVYQSQVARDISYRDLQKLLLKEMTTMVTTQTLTSQQEEGVFQVRVCEGSEEGVSIASSVELPLYSQSVDQALALCCPHQPQHLKLLLLWQAHTKQKYIVDDVDHVEKHSSVEELKRSPPQPPPTTLSDCLRRHSSAEQLSCVYTAQLHSSAEQLSSGDAWHCPSCDRKEQGVKRLMLWSAPQILVLHLKRFRQNSLNSNSSSKLNTFVSFPLTDVDISEYVAQRNSYTTCATAKQSITKSSPENCKKKSGANNTDDSKDKTITTVSNVGSGVWSPWRKPKRLYQQQQLEDKHVYDLYAVCNHHGKDLQGGHYTAVCHNPSSGEWYEFDDSRVKQIPEDKVVTQDAYLLFYQRRQSNDGPCATTVLNKEHWSYRIPRDCLPASLNPPIAKQPTASETVVKPTPCSTSTSTSPTTEPMVTSTASTDAPPAPTSPLQSDDAVTTTPTPPSATLPAWKPFERGRSYGTLPGHGRSVLQTQESTERENSSDTEAPLAIQDSPIKKRISDVQERRESEEEDTEEGSPMDTIAPHSPLSAQINGLSSNSDAMRKTDSVGSQSLLKPNTPAEPASEIRRNSAVNYDNSHEKNNLTGQVSSPGSKTVYISRNQAIEQSKSPQQKCSCPTKEEEQCRCKDSLNGDAKKPSAKNLATTTSSASSSPATANRATPDVLIQPASPAVLAAHKKSVITVTLRQRSPSISSQPISRSPSTCSTTSRASRASLVSRASVGSHKLSNASSVSSFSPETLASIITVNGVSLADNEELSAEFANSLAVSTAASYACATPDECCKYDCNKPCGCGDSKSLGKSVNGDASSGATGHLALRSSHVNKTPSYVHVNCPAPSTSPRCNTGGSSRSPFNRSPNGSGRSKLSSSAAAANGCSSSAGSRSLVVSTNGADSVYLSHSFKDNQCNPSIISKNSRNTARSSVESVPSNKTDNYNGKLSSASDGCRCHRSSTSSSNSRNYNSDNVGNSLALRNSCGNFSNLRNGEPGCTGGRCSCRYKDSVSCGPGRVNRHSSGSLDSSHVNVKVSSRERCGSECMGDKLAHLDKNTKNKSYIGSCDIRTCICRSGSSGVGAPVTCSAAIQRSAASLACCSAVPDDCTCGAVRPSSTATAESSV
ncbi:Peptidase C19 ubiquitin carboxyl-terminal hydrolase [Trinorchestia longiramus]|nr:Peptidase C19 ubiquitin carboxyl-terminal hydrolase [Trinorchestia longiramus]